MSDLNSNIILLFGVLIQKKILFSWKLCKGSLHVTFVITVKCRLFKLGIKSLEYRRAEFDLMLMYKICHNFSDLQFNDYFFFRHASYNLRQHSFTVQSI